LILNKIQDLFSFKPKRIFSISREAEGFKALVCEYKKSSKCPYLTAKLTSCACQAKEPEAQNQQLGPS
jgi:hypothetical protein